MTFAIIIIFGGAMQALATSAALDTSKDVVSTFSGSRLVPCGTKSSSTYDCDWSKLIILANNIVTFLVWLSMFLAILAFCYAGFLYMTAFGEMGKIEQAHGIFKSTMVGLFFVLCGWLIIATILKVLVVGDNANIGSIINFSNITTLLNLSNQSFSGFI